MASRDMPRLIAWVARVCLSWCGVTRPRPACSAALRTATSMREALTGRPWSVNSRFERSPSGRCSSQSSSSVFSCGCRGT